MSLTSRRASHIRVVGDSSTWVILKLPIEDEIITCSPLSAKASIAAWLDCKSLAVNICIYIRVLKCVAKIDKMFDIDVFLYNKKSWSARGQSACFFVYVGCTFEVTLT